MPMHRHQTMSAARKQSGATVTPTTLVSSDKAKGITAGGTGVTLTGTQFVTNGVVRVTIDGVDASIFNLTETECLVGATGHAGGGPYDIVLYPVYGPPLTLAAAFTYVDPVFLSFLPTSGPAAGGTTVTITGTDFDADTVTGVQFVDEDGTPNDATSVVYVNPTTITCVSPAGSASGISQGYIMMGFTDSGSGFTCDPDEWDYT